MQRSSLQRPATRQINSDMETTMRPGSNKNEAMAASKNGLLIREDLPGLMQVGQAARGDAQNDWLGIFFPTPCPNQFIMCIRIPSRFANGKELHAIVDLSRRLGYSC